MGSTVNYGQSKTSETFYAMARSSKKYSEAGSVTNRDFFDEVDKDSLLDEGDERKKGSRKE